MNIESANLSPLAPSSSGTVESVSPPSIDGGVISEGFSGALMAQVELLSNIKAGDSLPLQTPDVAGLQGVVVTGLPATATKVDAQDVAALLGNDLPPSYKTKDDGDHEAALAAVTDTLKYITMGTTAGEKAAAVEQNMKDVIAMAAPAEQGMGNVVASAVPAEQNMKNVVVAAVPVEQNATDVVAEPEQSVKDVAMGVPVQMVLEQRDDKSDKKQDEGGAQIAVVENNSEAEGVLAVAIILPPVMQAEQAKTANNLTPADAIKEGGLPSFTNPLAGDAKSNQSAKAPENALQSETVFRQLVQDKQGFNLNYVENSGQAEKTGRVDQQVLSVEGEKAVPRVGADITQLNRPVVDNKSDVPAMTKPLSHPEWNKDLGERIVWMNSRAIPSAEIRLNPPHLGPISVRVDVSDDQATVVFTAQHAAVRETLEASIPKLREMMSAQHLNLAEVNVSQGSASDQGRSQSQSFAQTAEGRGQGAPAVAVDELDDVEQEIANGQAVVSKGLLSIYA
ncbi:flagellar hook-length control protein FliK [Methylobacter tundripaludum]|uniref:Flagellar hook-length control protein FliK n=1 Tax=Methylobacter tundripaludum TaxID=173365 RepID=A0A2S6HAE9_9GAMM|nr:flagellar hook-length control protein FliK [Methylobacter tundripaludum]PPK74445.1 flagellar hook-length control protein FliK [Methylobacter tundripaludum]